MRRVKTGGMTVATEVIAMKKFPKLKGNLGASSVTETTRFHKKGALTNWHSYIRVKQLA